MKLIQVYAPTSSRPDEEVEQLYEEVQRQLTTDCHYHIVMGDFNAKIGIKSDEQERSTGKFGSGERNDRGDLLIEWATANNMKIMNTVYKKKISRRWTWQSPDGCTRNEIDYIMTNRPNIFTDVKVLNRLDAGSDHRAVMGVIRINVRKDRQKCLSNPSKRPSIEQLVIKKDEFQILLKNRFSALELEGEDGVDEMNDRITTTILECASEVASASIMKDSKLSTETRILMKKRRMMKKTEVNNNRDIRNNIEYAELDKTIKKKAREDIRKQNMKKIAETIENKKSMKRAKRSFQLGQDRMLTLLDKDENELTTQDQILERVEEFYGELYASNKEIEISTKACDLPDITAWEVESAVQKMKNGKAAGNDNIKAEMVKAGGDILSQELARLFTKCLHLKEIPVAWKNANMIIMFKKGNRKDIKNYRPICLLSNLYKIYTKILTERLTRQLDEAQPKEQAGFRGQYTTTDHMHTVNQLKEKCLEYNIPLCVAFVDYEKAFDSVETQYILASLQDLGIEDGYVDVIRDIYTDSSVTVKLHKTTNKIRIKKGVRQGDTISPKLFTAALERIFRDLDWQDKGINIDGTRLNHLRFADDIIIVADDAKDLEEMLEALADESAKSGLKMNTSKTKVMFGPLTTPCTVKVNTKEIEAGAVTNSSYSLPTESVKNYISADGIASWIKAWLGVLSREANTARMTDENLTAEVEHLHRSDNNFERSLQDVQQKVNIIQAENVALSGQVAALKRQVKQFKDIFTELYPGCKGRSVTFQNKEYYFVDPSSKTSGTQVMGQACCQLMGKNLVAVNSAEELKFIQDHIWGNGT
ncbi:uncharacterized protein LOC106154146 [Lingula anatina]|uniref:Uncharacterized protein LOC106154146 n=1 Tax=Lingula anatina TaxID=7574 RepID=A0A1S3HCU5_LINAN|nr:uncharacterized protein LOC106154146 [Lingula anatina]|eukprot:XP_013383867.1 uncharacterized protein LOC106154146 [Lingula anatina]